MTEQENVKVYELAKELGMDSISLLDKLNSLNIKVKSHMSELKPEELDSARQALGKKSKPAAAAPVKKAPTRARKKAAAPEPEAAPPAPKETAQAAKSASTVIRRRVKADGATETVSTGAKGGASAADLSTQQESSPSEASYSQAHEGALESADGSAAAYTETEPQEGEANAVAYSEDSASDPASTEQEAAVSETAAEAPGAAPKIERKPVVLPPRPVAPRRSILKIVEPTKPQTPNIIKPAPPAGSGPKITPRAPGSPAPDKAGGGFRVFKMTKENLDQMVEEEAAKKRGGGREAEIRPEDVRFADYRKKEMVFLPKKKKLPIGKELKQTQITTPKAQKRVVEMGETISVQELANQLTVKAADVIRKLMMMGQMVTINQAIDFDTATLVAAEYQYEVKNVSFKEEAILGEETDAAETLQPRPPVVTIMGHVDHGKTSLLDAIREADVVSGEAGGITQHIGAYTIKKDGKFITFIDTPGHEAFTVMRARGANVTDIVVLVVAADDGVMPQTREALSHAQAANVPIIVAVNKIDKPNANPDKIKQGLAELNLLAEDWGGQTMFVPVSAVKKTNIDKLLESILLQAEVLDLKANPNAHASGSVLEARLEKGRGPVVSILIRRGTLKVGDPIVSGPHAGKVKALTDDKGQPVKQATPGVAVEVLGFEGVPSAGDRFDATADEAGARQIAQFRIDQARSKKEAAGQTKVSLDDLFSKIQAGSVKELNVVLKADVFGSVEAIRDSLNKLSNEKVKVKVIFSAPGGITESDVMLASASNAIIIGFNVRPETKARQIAEAEGIDVKCYNIIYELIEEVKQAMVGILDKKKVEKFLGRAEVRQTFSVPKVGVIAGSTVIDGKVIRGANVRLLRDSRVIFEGKMNSLKRFKDDAKEVASGFECGIGLEGYNDLKPGDVIEAYQIEMVTPELNS